MVKYARMVFEVPIEDDAEDQEIVDAMESSLTTFMTEFWGIDDIEIHSRPYIADECNSDIVVNDIAKKTDKEEK